MKKMEKKFALVIAIAIAIFVFGGCSAATSTSAATTTGNTTAATTAATTATQSKGTIVVLVYNSSLDIFANAAKVAIAAGEKLGYDVVFDGTPEVDTQGLVAKVENYTQQQVKAICIASGDSKSVVPATQAAMEKGIKVVSWDLDIAAEGRDAYAGCMDTAQMGIPQVKTMIDCIGTSGEWAIVTSLLTNEILNARIDVMKEYVAKNYPNLKLLTVETNGGQPTKTYEVAQNILTAYPEVDAIMSNISSGLGPIATAIDDAGKAGEVFACGQSTPKLARTALEKGIAKSAFLWDTGRWASWAVTVAANLIEGTSMPDGNMVIGDFTKAIRQGDIFYYNEDLFFTKENIAKYDF